MKMLLTGNEAIARGAWESGVSFASAYPGTPSTEILENIALFKDDIYSEWAPNEKVALESAIGASIAGVRAIAVMKHVGVNVAADPLFTFAYTGVNSGMVLISADDPGMHSSQNEQDNRNYAAFAKIAMFEPSDSQESKDMIEEALRVSEEYDIPVLIRMTTRISHSKGIVDCAAERQEQPGKPYVKNIEKYIAVPAHSKKMRANLEERLKRLSDYSETTNQNVIEWNRTDIGVITSGIVYQYAREALGKTASYLKLGFTHPLPLNKIKDFSAKVDKLYVIEEGDPYLENQLKAAGITCYGRDTFPGIGEISADLISRNIMGIKNEIINCDTSEVSPRPPAFCAGCPHRGFFYQLGKIKNIMITGDIGCYALAFNRPYNALDSIICMGASISMGHGAQKAFEIKGEDRRSVAVLGDSTFFHTGINSLLNVIYNNSKTITCILDNRITGMTGHQENPGSGYTLMGDPASSVNIEDVCRSLGMKNIRTINPNDLNVVKETLKWALALDRPSVIITRWPCILKKFSKEDKTEFGDVFSKCYVDTELCISCKACLRVGCPSMSVSEDSGKVVIDTASCTGCGVCLQVCPSKAIIREEKDND